MSIAIDGKNIPEIPPSVKVTRKPRAQRVWVLYTRDPPCIVISQLNILMPVGTATSIVVSIVTNLSVGLMPLVNMWWP